MVLPPEKLRQLIRTAIKKAYPEHEPDEVLIEFPADEQHGDYSSPVALKLAKKIGQPPREVAQHILAQMGKAPILEKAEVAGPGFINFFVKSSWLMSHLPKLMVEKKYGANNLGGGKKMLVEFISANPTGPMTLGNGRGAFTGDTIANILSLSGWKVTREYYMNDVGNQVNILAESVIRRYFKKQGIPTDLPDHLYQGNYIEELAETLKLDKMKLQNMATLQERIKGRVLRLMIKSIQKVVEKKLNIHFNSWLLESSIYAKKLDAKVLDHLRRHSMIVERDGATWFRTTAFGDDKDRVLIKSDGEKTYLLSDIGLRYNRFVQRGFDREVLYLGADHHGYVKRLHSIMAALGHADQLEVELVQMVKLIKDGKEVKMSKRAGTYVTLEEVVDDVGLDVARFFFLMHAPNTHMDFDINKAKDHSEKNPVFYVQYANARVFGILEKTKKLKKKKLSGQLHETEVSLMKQLLYFPDLVAQVSINHEVQKLPFYSQDLARTFHNFYTHCRVIEDNAVWDRRLNLVLATRQVLKQTLTLMGISAPDRM